MAEGEKDEALNVHLTYDDTQDDSDKIQILKIVSCLERKQEAKLVWEAHLDRGINDVIMKIALDI